MSWIVSSILMFVSSVVLYVFVRKNSLENTPSQLNNLAMFAIPVLLYIIQAVFIKENMTITIWQASIIIIQAVLFSYLGNVFSLRSIEYAPNPGYSLVLSKSYVVMTTLVSIIAFGAELTIKNGLAIVIIIGFSALVMIGKSSQNKNYNKSWAVLAVGAFICWGMLSLSSKYLYTLGVGVTERLIYSMIVVTILIIAEMRRKKISIISISRSQQINLVIIGIAGASFNYFMQLGIKVAPNIGYVNAINASSIAAVTIVSAIMFKDELSKKKLAGVFGVVAGLVMLIS